MSDSLPLSRRAVLGYGAASAGAVAAASLLPPSVQAALAQPAKPGGLPAIKHVVYLVQENRSFDHYYGSLRGVRGFGDPNAVRQRSGRSVFAQPKPGTAGGEVLPFSVREAAKAGNKDIHYIGDLPHGWADGHKAWAEGWFDGWIGAKGAATMAYYDRTDLPFHYELADTFTICDAYHCSVMSSTSPNRNYHVSGTIGYEPNGKRATGNSAYAEDTHPGYTWGTYAERLEQAGKTWKVYQEWDNYQDNNLEFHAPFKQIARKALAGLGLKSLDSFYGKVSAAADPAPLFEALAAGVATLEPGERARFERALHRVRPGTLAAAFRADVEAGTLPQVSYLVPSAKDSEHPGASSPAASANITYQVLDALASNPDVWASTALFITYDENDGYFDHVPPPVPPAAFKDEWVDGQPIGLGIRVPMIVVSPWTVGGYVCSETFDHTSMVRFTEEWLGVAEPNISTWRRTVAGDLTSAFCFDRGRRQPAVTSPAPTPPATPRWRPVPPATQAQPVQEDGTRPARPLPYQPDASYTGGVLSVRNDGPSSAHLIVWPYAGEFTKPQHLDVLGSSTLDVPATDTYQLLVTGPNGFRREFTGAGAEQIEVRTAIRGLTRQLAITLVNRGPALRTFVVDGERRINVKPGREYELIQGTARSHGWYDMTITVAEEPGFARRLAGHLENGKESISG
ncbi:phosphocholine-specific phospholipase C [Longispora albida]|uniref:phosphocholine-specific phospholipase C n=1 Tax=Longispora albida TaxID=203523 RepID=UPI0003711396|nr:phospholipase C, phosphocholine-specific [Longispora albida]